MQGSDLRFFTVVVLFKTSDYRKQETVKEGTSKH